MKVITLCGYDCNNKKLRKKILVECLDDSLILYMAFKLGFTYVRSYIHNGITIKMY